MSNFIRKSHLFMFLAFALPIWMFSLFLKIQLINPINTSIWILFLVQTIPLVSWLVYTSIIPSLIGEIRLGLEEQEEALSETVSTSVTTRATFLALTVAGIALLGFQVINAGNTISMYYLSIALFVLSFLSFVISTDVSDSAKNVPFRTSQRGVILTRRGARYYQYGFTYMICAFAISMTNISEVFCIMFIVLWDIFYLCANLPTQGNAYSRIRKLIILFASIVIILLPICYLLWDMLIFAEWQAIVCYGFVLLLSILGVGVILKYHIPAE